MKFFTEVTTDNGQVTNLIIEAESLIEAFQLIDEDWFPEQRIDKLILNRVHGASDAKSSW